MLDIFNSMKRFKLEFCTLLFFFWFDPAPSSGILDAIAPHPAHGLKLYPFSADIGFTLSFNSWPLTSLHVSRSVFVGVS